MKPAAARALGERMKRRRDDLGLTQENVAARAGMSRAGYQNIEAGKSESPQISSLRAIAEALDMDLADLRGTSRLRRRSTDHPSEDAAAVGVEIRAALKRFRWRERELAQMFGLTGAELKARLDGFVTMSGPEIKVIREVLRMDEPVPVEPAPAEPAESEPAVKRPDRRRVTG